MDDQRRRPDPTSRPDPYELAVARAASPEDDGSGQQDADGAPPLPRLQLGPLKVGPTGLLVGVVLLVAVGTLVRFDGDRTPDLPTSCTTPGVALSVGRVQPGGLVDYAVVGPGRALGLQVAPLAGGAPQQVLPPVRLQGCRATGRFGAQVPPGAYRVQVVVDGQAAAAQDLVVTDEGDPTAG